MPRGRCGRQEADAGAKRQVRTPGGRCERQKADVVTPSPFLSRSAGEEGGRGEGEGARRQMRALGGRCERQEAGANARRQVRTPGGRCGDTLPLPLPQRGREGGRGEGEGEIGQRRAVTPPYQNQNWLACMSDVHPDRRDGQCAANLRHFLCSTG
jgi:hypothetical protein